MYSKDLKEAKFLTEGELNNFLIDMHEQEKKIDKRDNRIKATGGKAVVVTISKENHYPYK